MGLFDSVRCEYPLPGTPPACAAGAEFQTKDLNCYMLRYTITADGRLVEDSGSEDVSNLTATIEFGWSNVVASGPGIYTRDGEDAQYLEYEAVFVNGRLAAIKEISNTSHRAMKFKPREYPKLTPAELQQIEARRSESLIGKTMCVWWGGSEEGYPVTIVAENQRELVAQKPDGGFEIIPRYQRDTCLFDSYEAGKLRREEQAAQSQRELREYQDSVGAPSEAKPDGD